MKRNVKNKASITLVKTAVFVAMATAFLFLSSFIPGFELTAYAVAGFMTGFVIVDSNIKNAAIFFVATSILGFILMANKLAIIPYLLFFGIYGFIKLFAEKYDKLVTQIIVKAIFFFAILAIALAFFRDLFFANLRLGSYSLIAISILSTMMFIIYDYIYTLAINIYISKFKANKMKFKLFNEDIHSNNSSDNK